jgi:hypothetical protein
VDTVVCLEEKRTVSNDWVVRYANRWFQLERQSGQPPARSTVLVYESVDGEIAIRYRGRVMRWTDVRPHTPISAPNPQPTRVRQERGVVRNKPHVSDDHPWRHVVDEYETAAIGERPAGVECGAPVKRLWKLPEPWTRRARAHRSLENYRTVFHELPQPSPFL